MQIRNVTNGDIERAMAETNARFGDNICFDRLESVGPISGKSAYQVTLKAVDSSGPGARRTQSGRRSRSACFHAWGTFMDALPAEAELHVFAQGIRQVVHPDQFCWRHMDRNVGSMRNPVMLSRLCDCDHAEFPI